MGGAAGEDEQVPGGMEVAPTVEREEDDAEGVSEATGEQPQAPLPANGAHQRPGRKDHKPSLKQVNGGGGSGKSADSYAFEENSGGCQGPDDGEEQPAGLPAQRYERERRVGAGDEQVDGGVVEYPEDLARACAHQGVIERGAHVDEHERGGKDAATGQQPDAAVAGGRDEVDAAGDGESSADAVRDGVGEDVAEALLSLHRLRILRAETLRRGRLRLIARKRVAGDDLFGRAGKETRRKRVFMEEGFAVGSGVNKLIEGS